MGVVDRQALNKLSGGVERIVHESHYLHIAIGQAVHHLHYVQAIGRGIKNHHLFLIDLVAIRQGFVEIEAIAYRQPVGDDNKGGDQEVDRYDL